MAPVNYAELYEQALVQKYSVERRFNALYNTVNNTRIRYMGGKTIHIPSITVTGFTNVNRDVITGWQRNVDNEWEPKILSHDREFSTLVDPMDIDETNMALSIANVTQVFNDEEKIPEMDKYMASKLYAEAVAAGVVPVTTVPDVDNVLQLFDEAMQAMDDAEVPQEGRILYVTPQVNTLLKSATPISRFIGVRDNVPGRIARTVRSLDEVEIVVVPSVRMKTVYDFTTGAVPDPSAKQIHWILIHPTAIFAPQKYDFVSVQDPTALSKGKYLYYERLYWDVFVLEKRAPGISLLVEP